MKVSIFVFLVAILSLSTTVLADTNKQEFKQNLSKKGWNVAFGTEIDHKKQLEYTAAGASTAACVAGSTGSAVPACLDKLAAYIKSEVKDSAGKIVKKLQRKGQSVAIDFLIKIIVNALAGKSFTPPKGLDLDADLATYNHWRYVIYDEPRTRIGKCGPKWARFNCPEIYTVSVKKKIPLPNTFQPYVRFRIR
jgi:hypothetical protein